MTCQSRYRHSSAEDNIGDERWETSSRVSQSWLMDVGCSRERRAYLALISGKGSEVCDGIMRTHRPMRTVLRKWINEKRGRLSFLCDISNRFGRDLGGAGKRGRSGCLTKRRRRGVKGGGRVSGEWISEWN